MVPNRRFVRSSVETVATMVVDTDIRRFKEEPRIHKVQLVNGATIAPVDVEYGMPYLPKGDHLPLWAIDGTPEQVRDAVETLDQTPIAFGGTRIAAKAQELATLIEDALGVELYGGTKVLDRITYGSVEERTVLLTAVMDYMRYVSQERLHKSAYGEK